jgi:ParB family transcriptional regulator, chromosome partitioning protein
MAVLWLSQQLVCFHGLAAQQDNERPEQAIGHTTSVKRLAAIIAVVPGRLMKRDLLFVAERLTAMLNKNYLPALARQHSIKPAKESDSIAKLFTTYLRRVKRASWEVWWWS